MPTLSFRRATSLFLVALACSASAQDSRPVRTIAMSVDESVDEVQWLIDLFRSELESLLSAEYDVRFPVEYTRAADDDPRRLESIHDELLADPNVDLLIAMGPLASAELIRRGEHPKPCIAAFVWDALIHRPPLAANGGSGVHNLSYVRTVFDLGEDLEIYRRIVPFSQLTLLANESRLAAAAANREPTEAALAGSDVRLSMAPLREDVEATLAGLPADVGAVYLAELGPSDNPRMQALLDALAGRGIPVFSANGESGVRNGALAGLTPSNWFSRLARRCGLISYAVLRGDEAGDQPVHMAREGKLYLNMQTAHRLSISPTFDLMSDAVLIGSMQREPERTLDLLDVMHEALERNRDLAAAREQLSAADDDVSIARAALLPQLEATLAERWIDEDRAAQATAGAERTFLGRLEFDQLLFSERAWANHSVRKHLRRAADSALRRAELDVVLEASKAYLNVLSALADETIRRDNLNLTRSNLERAHVREELGAASPSEVFRWESQLAQDRDTVVTSVARRNLAELELNRVLHRPLESKVGLVVPRTQQDLDAFVDPRFLPYIDNQQGLRILRAFAALIAAENSPELAELDAAIASQERAFDSATRRFYVPDLALGGSWTETFDRGGAGADLLNMAPIDDSDWELTLGLSLPVFNGGERIAERSRTRADLTRLRFEREALLERIQQRARAAVHVAAASYTRIGFTQQASEAARRNLELVSDAYARGAVSIIELVDAQTAHLNSSTQAANASFQFLSDLMEVERSAGRYLLLSTSEDQEALMERFSALADDPSFGE